MDPQKEKVRYHLVFATNSLHGIEVFKDAEEHAAAMQDELRHETQIQREGPFLPFGDPIPKSRKLLALHERYIARVRTIVVKRLLTLGEHLFDYDELYAQAMAFPLVTADDLQMILTGFEPHIIRRLMGTHRKKLLLFKNDRIEVINSKALQNAWPFEKQ